MTLIAVHLHRQQAPVTAGPTLVVCPASLLGNWRREIERFAPGTGVLVHPGPKRRPPGETVAGGSDEAQHLKNRAASVTRALRTITPELPPKTQIDLDATLTPEQAGMYEALVREAMEQIEKSDGIGHARQHRVSADRSRADLQSPAQYLGQEHSALAGRSRMIGLLDELIDTNLSEGGRSLAFTHFTTMRRLLRRHLMARGVGCEFLHQGHFRRRPGEAGRTLPERRHADAFTELTRGLVGPLTFAAGLVSADVHTDEERLHVRIRVDQLDERQWREVLATLASRSGHVAQLSSGTLPRELDDDSLPSTCP
ncbi:SNF2-related protein [Rhodococcus sp. NPDC059968]|uniref:SNF2-related protein n=1 Tax=Rhodococcus sp. NPDC059968 TaxID=3347017 RepID=UPI003670EA7C